MDFWSMSLSSGGKPLFYIIHKWAVITNNTIGVLLHSNFGIELNQKILWEVLKGVFRTSLEDGSALLDLSIKQFFVSPVEDELTRLWALLGLITKSLS